MNDTPKTKIYTLSLHDALPIFDAINNVFRKFSAFHDETGRLNVDGMNIISNDGSNKRPVSSWKALNLRKTLLMASSVRLKPLNCSRLPCVYAQETLTFLLTQKKTCVKNYVQKE